MALSLAEVGKAMGESLTDWDAQRWLEQQGARQDHYTQSIIFPNGNSVSYVEMMQAGSPTQVQRILFEAAANSKVKSDAVELPPVEQRSLFWHISFVEEDGKRTPTTTAMSPLADTLILDGVKYQLIEWEVNGLIGYALFQRVVSKVDFGKYQNQIEQIELEHKAERTRKLLEIKKQLEHQKLAEEAKRAEEAKKRDWTNWTKYEHRYKEWK